MLNAGHDHQATNIQHKEKKPGNGPKGVTIVRHPGTSKRRSETGKKTHGASRKIRYELNFPRSLRRFYFSGSPLKKDEHHEWERKLSAKRDSTPLGRE